MVGRKRNTVDSYFLAGREMNWALVIIIIKQILFKSIF